MIKASKIISLGAILLLIMLAVALAPANTAKATCNTDVWVATWGDDTNPGTVAQPFATIQKGIDTVCGDGTVHVAAGTYHENLYIHWAQNLVGAGAAKTIIDGNDCSVVIDISSAPSANCISGFTIQHGNQLVWNPINQHVLYAGVKLPSIRTLPQLNIISFCGGGIHIGYTHIVTLNDCTVKDNAADRGGGICNEGKLYMNRCTVSGNTAEDYGGGIFNGCASICPSDAGQMWLTNCTISGNNVVGYTAGYKKHAPIFGTAIANAGPILSDGGGIYNVGTMELLNCTIANNYANGYGGGFANLAPDTAKFKNTIVANNTAGNSSYDNGYNGPGGVTVSQGHNLDNEDSCGFNKSTDLVNTDPLLGPLQDNGGPTFTCALPIDSPAVDAGDNNGAPDTDQRGVTRPQGMTVDIGAFELVGGGLPPSTEAQPSVSPSTTINWTRNLNPPTLSVQFVSINPQQATANQPVTISTNVVNTGDQGGNMNVALKINGQVEQTKMVSVGPQASQPIKFTVTKAQPGKYSVDIGGQTGSFVIPDTGSSSSAQSSGALVVFLILGVLILATIMVLLFRRRPA